MKKKNIFFILVFLLVFMVRVDVHAATCTKDEKQALKREALNVSYNFILIHDENVQGTESEYYYTIETINYSSNLKLLVKGFYYDKKNINAEGEIKIPKAYDMGSKETIEFYGADGTSCAGEYLIKKTVTVPYYNKYSEREECQDYQDYSICQPGVNTSNVSEEDFLAKIEKIKEENKPEDPIVEEKTFYDKVIEFVNENKKTIIISSVVVVIVIVVVAIKVYKNRKNRIKVDI